jgi:hypothetical protein
MISSMLSIAFWLRQAKWFWEVFSRSEKWILHGNSQHLNWGSIVRERGLRCMKMAWISGRKSLQLICTCKQVSGAPICNRGARLRGPKKKIFQFKIPVPVEVKVQIVTWMWICRFSKRKAIMTCFRMLGICVGRRHHTVTLFHWEDIT